MGNKSGMFAILTAIAILSLLANGSIVIAESAKPLSIDDAVQYSMNHNAAVLTARDQVAAARARIGEAKADLFPELVGSSVYTHLTNVPGFVLATGATVPITAIDEVLSTVTLRQSVYTGGRIHGNVSRAEALYDASVGSLAATQSQVALQTRQAYYAVLLNQALVLSAQDTLTSAQKQAADASSRYQAGTAARFDVLRAQTQVSQGQQFLVQAQNQVEISNVAFKKLIGASFADSFSYSEPVQSPVPTEPVSSLIEIGERQRGEILAARAQAVAAEQVVRIARSGMYPQISLSASYEDVTQVSPSQVPGFTYMASISKEIFDAGRISSSVKEAKSLRDESKINLLDTQRGVEQDVRQSYLNILTAEKTEDTAKATLAQAKEAYDVATVRYQSGVGTATEIADALASLTLARTNLDTARFNYNIAYASLVRALGSTK